MCIYTAEELVGGIYYLSTATQVIVYPIRERMGTTQFWEINVCAKLPFLQNYRLCKITVFANLPFLRNYRFWEITVFEKLSNFFICIFILQKSLLEAFIILAPQLMWSDTPYESEWAPPYFEKLPFLQNYRFCEITVFDKLSFLSNYRFFLLAHL